MKKLILRIARPVPVIVLAATTLAAVFVSPEYAFPLAVLLGGHLLVEALVCLSDFFIKRRKGPKAVQDNLIQVYVDDITLDRVEQMADMAGVSVPVFCYCVLQSLEPDELVASAQLRGERDHG